MRNKDHDNNFDGFINVVSMKARKYNGSECVDSEIYDDKKPKVIELHTKIEEQVALTDDKYLDKYFSGKTLTMDTPLHQDLIDLYPKVLVTPHIASSTDKALIDMIEVSLKNMDEYFEKGTCVNSLLK